MFSKKKVHWSDVEGMEDFTKRLRDAESKLSRLEEAVNGVDITERERSEQLTRALYNRMVGNPLLPSPQFQSVASVYPVSERISVRKALRLILTKLGCEVVEVPATSKKYELKKVKP